MKRSLVAFCLIVFAASAPAEEPGQGSKLFNGTDLTGWAGTAGSWSVKEGAIVGRSDKNLPQSEYLWSAIEVKDFYLALDVKLESDSGAAGIQFRSKKLDNRGQARGYQAGIGKGSWGRLFHEQGRGKLDGIDRGEKAVKPGEWNRYEILAVGPRLWIAINGKLSVAHSDPNGERAGHLALGILSGPSVTVHFRIDKLVRNPQVELAGLNEKQLDAEIGNPPSILSGTIVAHRSPRGNWRTGRSGVQDLERLWCG